MLLMQFLQRQWRREDISVRRVIPYLLFICLIFYLAGAYYSPTRYQQLEQQLQDSMQQVEVLSDMMVRQGDDFQTLRARGLVNEKRIALLNNRIAVLMQEEEKQAEKVALYRRILGSKAPDQSQVDIRLLEVDSGFEPGEWLLRAILTRSSQKRTFAGFYYFEVVQVDATGVQTITRYPTEKQALDLTVRYYELEEIIHLPHNNIVKNARLTLLDKKGEVITSAEIDDMEASVR